VLLPRGCGVATSGTYLQGQHIYDPHGGAPDDGASEIVSLTIVGPDVMEADCYATAAFAMGRRGIAFIEGLPAFEAYEIDASGMARMTSGLERYLTC
jgi:thiamine biosynthesis lipoprotein